MYRRSYSSGLVSRAKRNRIAASEQRDATQVVLNQNFELSCGETMFDINGNNDPNDFYDTGTLAINIFEVLRRNQFFKEYTSLYDQVKIDSVKVKIIGVNWINGNNNSSTDQKIQEYKTPKSYVVVTAWDRSGISSNDIVKSTEIATIGGVQYQKPVMYINIGRKITSYSSALTKHLGPGSSYEIVRQCYPSASIEKEQYVSTDLIKAQYNRSNKEGFKYRLYNNVQQGDHKIPVGINQDSSLPTNLLEDPAIAFKPTLLVNVIAGSAPKVIAVNQYNNEVDIDDEDANEVIGVNCIKPVTFSLEFNVIVTFRGLRYSRIVI